MKEFIKDIIIPLWVIGIYYILTSTDRFIESSQYERDAITIAIVVVWFLAIIYNIAKVAELILNKLDTIRSK